jgi:hypothetical protein
MVYALAEKYDIQGLKALALRKFKDTAVEHWATEDFLRAAREAYMSTIEADRGLRDQVVAILHEHAELLSKKETQDVLKELGMLAHDLLMYTHRMKAPEDKN